MKAKGGSAQKKGLHVGDRVRFLFGKDPVEGVIVEDRGLLAAEAAAFGPSNSTWTNRTRP